MASDVDPRFDPVFQRGYDGPPPALAEALEASSPSPALEPRSPSLAEALEARSPYRNPWLIALWITTALFVAGGIGAQYFSQSLLQTGNIYDSAIDYYVVSSTVSALAPWFVGAGLFSGVAALVLSAVRWRPAGE